MSFDPLKLIRGIGGLRLGLITPLKGVEERGLSWRGVLIVDVYDEAA